MGRLSKALRKAEVVIKTVNSTSDAFPPLKSASGGVVAILQIIQQVDSNRDAYAALVNRISGIARDLANLPDETTKLERLETFKRCLDNMANILGPLASKMSVLQFPEHELIIRDCNSQLDSLIQDVQLWSSLRQDHALNSIHKDLSQLPATIEAHFSRLALDVSSAQNTDNSEYSYVAFHVSASWDAGIRLSLHLDPVACVLFA